ADAVNAQPPIGNSVLGESVAHHTHEDRDHFGRVAPDTNWKSSIEHAVKIGLGSAEYELITVK
ncbi:MAG: 4Fe-4S ferredoxin, partial [Lachnospiraceae bacterium]|nr:4Fe-4S ferredoxin [Lachnospiraceae bacterium]